MYLKVTDIFVVCCVIEDLNLNIYNNTPPLCPSHPHSGYTQANKGFGKKWNERDVAHEHAS